VVRENVDGDEVFAQLHEATSHPGSDIELIVNGETIRTVQLKATDNAAYVKEHFDRYPGIDIVATEEVAAELSTVQSSGYSNANLTESVEDAVNVSSGDVVGGLASAASTSLLVSAAFHAGETLRSSRISKDQLRQTMKDVAVGGGTAAILELLLG
jgi:hypothetical protein